MAPFFKKKKHHSKNGSQESNHTNDSHQRSITNSSIQSGSGTNNSRLNSGQGTPPQTASSRTSSYTGTQHTPVRKYSNSAIGSVFNSSSRTNTPQQALPPSQPAAPLQEQNQQQQSQQLQQSPPFQQFQQAQQSNVPVGFTSPSRQASTGAGIPQQVTGNYPQLQQQHTGQQLVGAHERQFSGNGNGQIPPSYRNSSGNFFANNEDPYSGVGPNVGLGPGIPSGTGGPYQQPQSGIPQAGIPQQGPYGSIPNQQSPPPQQIVHRPSQQQMIQEQQQQMQQQQQLQQIGQQPPIQLNTPWKKKRLYNSPFPRFSHAASSTTSDTGAIYLMGGLCGQNVFGDMWVIEPVKNDDNVFNYEYPYIASPIENFERVPAPRIGHSSVLIGNAFIVFAGDTVTSSTQVLDNKLYFFNITSLKWTITAPDGPRPDGRYGHQISVLNFETDEEPNRWLSYLYVFGGQLEDKYFNDIWRFDLSNFRDPTTHWVKLDPAHRDPNAFVPPALSNHSMSAYGNCLYVYGGTDGKTVYGDLLCFSAETETWKKCTLNGDFKPPALEDHAAGLYQNLLFIYGGKKSNGEPNYDLYLIDLNNLNCFKILSNLPSSPGARSGHSLTVDLTNEKLIIMGGDQDDNNFNDVYETKNELIDETTFRYPSSVIYEFDMDLLPKYMERSMRNAMTSNGEEAIEEESPLLDHRKSQQAIIYEDVSGEDDRSNTIDDEEPLETRYDYDGLEKSLRDDQHNITADNKQIIPQTAQTAAIPLGTDDDNFSSSTPGDHLIGDSDHEYGQIPSVHLESPQVSAKQVEQQQHQQQQQSQLQVQQRQQQDGGQSPNPNMHSHQSSLSSNIVSKTGLAAVAVGGTASAITATGFTQGKVPNYPIKAVFNDKSVPVEDEEPEQQPKLGSPLLSHAETNSSVKSPISSPPECTRSIEASKSNDSNSNPIIPKRDPTRKVSTATLAAQAAADGTLTPAKLQGMIQNLKMEFTQKVNEANDRIVELEKEKEGSALKIKELKQQLVVAQSASLRASHSRQNSESSAASARQRSLSGTSTPIGSPGLMATSSPKSVSGNDSGTVSLRSKVAYENQLLYLNNENKTLKEKINAFEPFMNEKIESLKGLNSVIKTQQTTIKQLETRLVDQVELQKKLNDTEKQLTDLRLEFDKFKVLKGDDSTIDGEKDITSGSITDKHTQINELSSQLDDLLGIWSNTPINDSVNKSVVSVNGSTNNITSQSNASNEKLVQSLQSQIDELLRIKEGEDQEQLSLRHGYESTKRKLTDLEENYKQSINSLNNTHRALNVLQTELEKQKASNKQLRNELEEVRLKRKMQSPRNFSTASMDHSSGRSNSLTSNSGFGSNGGGPGSVVGGLDSVDEVDIDDRLNDLQEEVSRSGFKIKDLQADLYIVRQERDQLKDELVTLKKRMLFDSTNDSD
ncbi:unnamed protein product [Ambrosiozyma monospora]|uniref:Unnamed protein product n=1 Tax=Ambrosiozyma monospora TaxID=43982 RepID=A0A9W6YYT5_AMBMO|nr:unnamed protein product [Ambrosiozyma monospora]